MRSNGKAKHILVINDTKEILDLFKVLLEEEGYQVSLDNFSALDAGVKLEEVKRLQPDALVLDFIIGGEPLGWQFLQLLKMDCGTKSIPVVICTAAVRQVEELESHLRTMGVETVLKPFDIDHALTALARALSPEGSAENPKLPSNA